MVEPKGSLTAPLVRALFEQQQQQLSEQYTTTIAEIVKIAKPTRNMLKRTRKM